MSHLAPGLLVLTLVSVISLMLSACQGAVCNQSGWFGKDSCQYKCHCTDDIQCDSTTGECSGRCAKGWFGPQCQYVELTTTQSTISTPSWLYDGNDDTCNTNTNLQTVTIQLENPLPLSWLRLSAKNPGNVRAFTLTFKTKTGDNTVPCNNMKTGNVNDKTLDIYCDLSVEVQEVILTGDGVKSLCSVYISGGRNVALKQSATQSSTQGTYGATKAVDGYTNGDFRYGSCTQTGLDTEPQWSVTFPLPQMINRYVLYNRQDDVPERLKYFILSSFNGTGSQVFQYKDNLPQAQSIYTIMSTTSTSSIKWISIKATQVTPDLGLPILTLCEVEAYGDTICENGKYGRECEQSCGNCLNNRCFVSTGWCINGCQDGYFGYTCDELCGTNCKDDVCKQDTGSCQQGCDSGFYGPQCENACPHPTYGPDCAQTCSINCTGQRCNNKDGKCDLCMPGTMGNMCDQDCPAKTYGQDCKATCSVNCVGQLCDTITGKCINCPPGKRGEQCEEECAPGKYGPGCTQTCNKNCHINATHNVACNIDTGICLQGCFSGYTGLQCESKMSEDSSADLAVGAGIGVGVTVLVCIIGISVYCYWRHSSRVAKARRQRPPGYEETVMNGQDEHQYRELFKSSDGYNLPTDATSAELSTSRSRSQVTVTENTTTPYANADVGHYEDITKIGNMDGATGDTISIGDVSTSLEKGRNNDGFMYANC